MLTVIGGTYIEVCHDPYSNELYGSGLRGAIALSGKISGLKLKSCIGSDKLTSAKLVCSAFGVTPSFIEIPKTISFVYNYPLSSPIIYPEQDNVKEPLKFTYSYEPYVLMYGQIEGIFSIKAEYLVYDPQSWVPFNETNSRAEHLALVLNRSEAVHFCGCTESEDLERIGERLLEKEQAEVVVIKDGAKGAFVIDKTGCNHIPVYDTDTVWPIGSGDIFSAIFTWQWAIEKKNPVESAIMASCFTAQYCETKILPITELYRSYIPLKRQKKPKRVYLAGPFFTIRERWLVNELRVKLIEFGNNVFSPFHDVGIGSAEQVVSKDLEALNNSNTVLAIIDGLDAGTLFEVGYARALGKKVIALAENVKQEDLTMLVGSGCTVVSNISTAIYKASW